MEQAELLHYLKESASIGVSKTSLIAFLKELNYTDSEIRRLLNKLNLKSRPKGINYSYFYYCPIHPEARQLVKPKYNTQIFALDNFLSDDECSYLMEAIDKIQRPSTVADPKDSNVINRHRTSQTADLHTTNDPIINKVNYKLAELLDLDSNLGEAIQGQKYLPGQYYKAHTDFFRYHTKEYKVYTEWMGQRTWTTMIYLNDVEEGGETYFKYLYLKVKPKRGTIVFWNNLFQNGRPNQKTLHEALPPTTETKYVITKWWRSWPVV
jgi:prolyl 4-hydroxylase